MLIVLFFFKQKERGRSKGEKRKKDKKARNLKPLEV